MILSCVSYVCCMCLLFVYYDVLLLFERSWFYSCFAAQLHAFRFLYLIALHIFKFTWNETNHKVGKVKVILRNTGKLRMIYYKLFR